MAVLANLLTTLVLLLSALLITDAPLIKRASLQQVKDSSIKNPTNVGFYIYVPEKLAPNPPIIVAIHFCNGNAQAYFTYSPYANLADSKGFIVLYPSSPWSGTCWDVSSKASLTHNGGGDSNAIANFVTWALNKYNGDPKKVFVTGTSSGAMMTNVIAAAYPDMFAAAVAYSGVAAGCFVSTSGGSNAWNNSCANGQAKANPTQWANVVHDMYKGYTGNYPKIQIYHGSSDTTLAPNNYNETVKQWAGVFGYSYPAQKITRNAPLNNYETDDFGPNLQGFYATGVGHNVPIRGNDDLAFFGI